MKDQKQSSKAKARIAVVSPFIDKHHGTERGVVEWLTRLESDYDIHLYSQRVEDVDLSTFTWHRIPTIPGPHLVNYLWWFAANHFYRWRDRRFRELGYDLVFTPGVNCFDADVIAVYIVFAEFYRQTREELRFRANTPWFWPRLLHRRLYYGLIKGLERRIYTNPRNHLFVIARKTAKDIKTFFRREDDLPVAYIGLDHAIFNPAARKARRQPMREELGLPEDSFVLLLIGNDWKKKGLSTIIEALLRLKPLPITLLVAGQDDRTPFLSKIHDYGLDAKVRFLPSRSDVIAYYSAADAYIGPSLEDTFAFPPMEAMGTGLPVITTATNGTSEIMTHGVDGFVLQDPADVTTLADLIERLYRDPQLRQRMGEAAASASRRYTWDRSAQTVGSVLREVLRTKLEQSNIGELPRGMRKLV